MSTNNTDSERAPLRSLRVVWTDLAGVRRCRALPWRAALAAPSIFAAAAPAAPLPRVGLTRGCMGAPVHLDTVYPDSGLTPVGETLLTPDPEALVPRLPWWPAHGMANACHLERSGEPWACCPRSALKRCLARLEERHGLKLLAGFELEFVILKEVPQDVAAASPLRVPGTNYVPVESGPYSNTRGFDAVCGVLDAMVQALVDMGIGVIQFHKEAGPGQFEIATAPAPALAAADRLIQSKEAICAVARRSGYEVTFVPKPFQEEAGSGCHVHLSLWKDGGSAMWAPGPAASPPRLSEPAGAFFGGVLSHLPALLPFLSPSPCCWGSYGRLRPGCWAGAYSCWGWDNREAPLRATGGHSPEATNFELKPLDGTANPYVALAAAVCAGALGLESGASLPPPLQDVPGVDGSSSEGGGGGGAAPLPTSLAEALEAWGKDDKLRRAVEGGLGAPLVRAFFAVRRGELADAPALARVLLRY